MRRAAVERWTSGAAVEQGLDLAAQVGATASEALRTRREPAAVARRRQRAARRRVRSWSAASAATILGGAGVVAVGGGLSAGVIVGLVVLAAILTLCVARAVRAAADLRARTRVVQALPPPSPRRSAVVTELRPQMGRLDGYSDGLRRLIGMIGLVRDDPSVSALRDQVVACADATEQRLRLRAADVSELIRARRRAAGEVSGELDATIAAMRQEVETGVTAYGRLVVAANDAADATRALAARTGRPPGLPAAGPARAPGWAVQSGPGSLSGAGATSGAAPGAGPAGSTRGPAPAGTPAGPDTAARSGAADDPDLADAIERLRALAAGMREITA